MKDVLKGLFVLAIAVVMLFVMTVDAKATGFVRRSFTVVNAVPVYQAGAVFAAPSCGGTYGGVGVGAALNQGGCGYGNVGAAFIPNYGVGASLNYGGYNVGVGRAIVFQRQKVFTPQVRRSFQFSFGAGY